MPHPTLTSRKHRSPAQWAELFARFEQSSLSVSAFCARESISAANFYRHRGVLGASAAAKRPAPQSQPAFVDLGSVGGVPTEHDDGLFFDEQRVPVQTIEVPNPEVEGLSPEQHEVIGEKVSHRLAQRPGSYVVLKYVRPVIKRCDTETIHCAPAPLGVIEGSRADVSFIVGFLLDKFLWHLPLYRQHLRLTDAGIRVSQAWLTQLCATRRAHCSSRSTRRSSPRFAPPGSPANPMTKALAYARNRRVALEVFLTDPDVQIDTNHLERVLRPIPMGRKNWNFCWTELGAKQVGIRLPASINSLPGSGTNTSASSPCDLAYTNWAWGARRRSVSVTQEVASSGTRWNEKRDRSPFFQPLTEFSGTP